MLPRSGLCAHIAALLPHAQFFIHYSPQFSSAGLYSMSSPSLCSCLVLLQARSLWMASLVSVVCFSTQLCVISVLAEGALDLTLCVFDKGFKMHQSQEISSHSDKSRDTNCHWLPPGNRAIDHNSLSVSIQPISDTLKGLCFTSISPIWREGCHVGLC